MRHLFKTAVIFTLLLTFTAGLAFAQDESEIITRGDGNDVKLKQGVIDNVAEITLIGNNNLIRKWKKSGPEACCSPNSVGNEKAVQHASRLSLDAKGNNNQIGIRQVNSDATMDIDGGGNTVLLNQDATNRFHEANIRINGNSNYGEVIQTNDSVGSGMKSASLITVGNRNFTQICQTGRGHTAVVDTWGNDNSIYLRQ